MSVLANRPLKWLFFDVGNTLLDETAAWQEQFERLAAAVTAAGRPIRVEQVWEAYHLACAGFAPKQWRAVVEACAPSPREVDGLMALGAGWRHDLEVPYPHVQATIERLATRYRLGVIANQSLGTRARLERHGLLPFISVVIGSAEAGVLKPDAQIFRLALTEAKCEPADAAMVGDRIDNDVRPAKALGLFTVHVRQGGSGAQCPRDAGDQADLTVDRIDELADLLG